MPDVQLLADFSYYVERHEREIHPDPVAVFVRKLHNDDPVDVGKLQLSIRLDSVRIQRLSWLVQPYLLLGPPKRVVRPIGIACKPTTKRTNKRRLLLH